MALLYVSISPSLFVLQGFEGFLTSKSAAGRNKMRNFQIEDRGFSLSSYTSPAAREYEQAPHMFNDGNGSSGGALGPSSSFGGMPFKGN